MHGDFCFGFATRCIRNLSERANVIFCLLMHKIPAALVPILFLPGLAFGSLVRVRNRLYSAGILSQSTLPGPVISIGNITLGGSGKTPLVIYLARVVAGLGFAPAILSRGYKRKDPDRTCILAPSENLPDPARALGDEPALMRRHLPDAWMGISSNRALAGAMIADRQARVVFILDDGFQHRRLRRDLDIVIIDPTQPLESSHVFPAGGLREPLSGLRRCHAIVLNRAPDAVDRAPEEAIARYAPGAAVFGCRQTIVSLAPFTAWKNMELESQPPRSAFLVAALGNPDRFKKDVASLGIPVKGARFYADHYCLTAQDWRRCLKEARQSGSEAVVITEKDAIKVDAPPDFPLLVAIQATEVSDANDFERMMAGCLSGRQYHG
jgi:tetraacyldisaccharide 4'-kinase